jgi:glucose-1-phosphate cytidylyltransferase
LFLANYGDGLSDAPINAMIEEVRSSDAVGNFLCVPPGQSFHVVRVDATNRATSFDDVTNADIWVNGGFFVFRDELWDNIVPGEELVYEPFARLMAQRRLIAHRHKGFWMGMDTFKEREALDEMYKAGRAPWEIWNSSSAR